MTTVDTNKSLEEENINLIKQYYIAYAASDMSKISDFFADDIEWNIPGHHPLAGQKKGKKEVVAFFKELANAKFKAEPIFFGANDKYVVDIHRGWSNANGYANVDTMWALIFEIKDKKIVRATNLTGDQHAADNFFWNFYKLVPLPDRLVSK